MNRESEAHDALEPSRWIARFAPLVRPAARVLDLACGNGRHSRWFAARGARVCAVDRDSVALASLAGVAGVETRLVDLEAGGWPLEGERFDVVIVTNYLHRPLLIPLLETLADDGVLLYETFAVGNEAYGRPANPAFLLRQGELLEWVRGRLTVIAFEQGETRNGVRPAVVQRIAAAGPGWSWPASLG